MANPARDIRNAAQARWAGASVVARRRNSIIHQHPTEPNKRMLDTVIGPVHIGNTEVEIDTAIQPSSGAWQYEMVQADYHVHMRNVFNAGNIIEYRDPISNQWVIFDPQSINWIDENNSRQQIAIKQAVNAQVNDDILSFPAAYGTGRHFHYQCQPGRLQKLITIDSLANLPTPTVQGNQKWFEAEFSLSTSSGVTIWLDGVQWAKTNGVRVRTANRIEYRDASGQQVFWWLDFPRAWDSAGNEIIGQMDVRRNGGPTALFITVRIPYEWVQAAAFPIYIDPTINPTVGADADDGHTGTSGNFESNTNVWVGNYYGVWNCWHRFTGISGLSGKTIDVSYMTSDDGIKTGVPNTRIYAERAASPTAPSSTSDYNSRTLTTAYTAWGGSDSVSPTPSLNSPLQELVDNFDPSAILILCKDNGSAANENLYSIGNYGWGVIKTLHIEYTEGTTPIVVAVGQVSESDAAQAVGRSKQKAVGQNAETDAALSMTPRKSYVIAVGQVSETDTAQAVGRSKQKAVGQNTETDEGLAVASRKQKAVGQNAETDAALSMTPRKSYVIAVGQVSETDTAQAVGRSKQKAVGQVNETDSALAFGTQIVGAVNQVSETDEAFQVSRVKYRAVGQVSEVDSAQGLTRQKSRTTGQASETDSLFALTGRKVVVLGQVAETDVPLAFGTTITEQVGQVSEADETLSITARKILAVSPVAETDLAQALFPLKQVSVTQVVETGSAISISQLGTIFVPIGQVVETDSARPILAGPFFGVATMSDSMIDVAIVSDYALWSAGLSDMLVDEASLEMKPL